MNTTTTAPAEAGLLIAGALGWTFDGIQQGFEGEAYCFNYTDRRAGTPTQGMTVSVLAGDHTGRGVAAAIEAARERVAA